MGLDGSHLEDYCGSQFWNLTLLGGSWPQFTICFQITVLYWTPALFLLLCQIPYFRGMYNRRQEQKYPQRGLSWLFTTRCVYTLILVVLAFADAAENTTNHQAWRIDPLIRGISLLWVLIMLEIDRRMGRCNNGYLCIYWLLMVIAGIIPFYSELKLQQFNNYWFGSFYIQFVLWCICLILSNISEKVPIPPDFTNELHQTPCPVTFAPFFSYTTYQWMHAIMFTGWKKSLEASDLWALNPENKIKGLGDDFERLWKEEKVRCEKRKRAYWDKIGGQPTHRVTMLPGVNMEDTVGQSSSTSDDTPLVPEAVRGGGRKGGKKNRHPDFAPNLIKILARQFGPNLLVAWGCKICYDTLQFANPLILNNIINFSKSDQPEWIGFFYSFAFLAVAVLCSQFFHQLFYIGMCAGMQIKSALIHAIYKKALYLDNDAKRKSTVGEIVNLMAIDSDRINLAVGYLWVLFSAPYQATLAFILLYQQVGNAVFGGLTIIIISIPLNFLLASVQRRLQVGQLKFKDRRIRQMAEILNGVKVIKLYAWEPPFIKRISDSRRQEMIFLIKAAYLNGINTFTWTFIPFLVMCTTFMIYVYGMDQPLTANKAFVTVALFNILRAPLNILPMLIAFLVQALVSLKRIARFLNHGDIDMSSVSREKDEKNAIRMEGVDLAWSKAGKPFLQGINLYVKHGSLTAIVGQVGAGKSSIVTSLLGDMNKVSGSINVSGEIAYIAQQAWIQNLSLRDNILFGKTFKRSKYETVIDACALKTDLEILPGGDQTEIGEKGINLSGGQKQRVNIARAVYQNCDIYLFDDPLSAVDSHVGKHLFDHVIGPRGILKSKTRVLVTHGLAFLKHVDNVVFMKDGRIEAQGQFLDLLEQCGPFKEFVQAANLAAEEKEELQLSLSASDKSLSLSFSQSVEEGRARSQSTVERSKYKAERKRAAKRRLFRTISFIEADTNASVDLTNMQREAHEREERAQTEAGALVSAEQSAEGRISWAVAKTYIQAIGYTKLAISMGLFALYQFCALGSQIWLSAWADWSQYEVNHGFGDDLPKSRQNMFASVYAAFGVGMAVFILLYGLTFSVALVRASAKLHRAILNNIMRCPMSFFDSVPSGRIVNRFSKDVEVTDNTLPQTVRSFLATFFTVLQIFVLITYSTPIFLVVLIPLCGFYWFVQRFYVKSSRQLKRVESTTRSPIFNHFSETLTGTTVIRAYGAEERFIEDNHARVDENNIYYYAGTIVAARWLGIRLEFLGSLVVLAASLLAVLERNSSNSGVVGLAVSSSLQITGALNWSVRMMSDLETYIVSVERLKEYTELENEADWNVEDTKPPSDWPDKGVIKFHEYATRYRADLDLVLRGISFEASPGEKIGIVGRTGAGKSSLTLALFRIIEAVDGYIEIDGHRLSSLGLHQLRPRLTILPQDPVLFSGSVRENLDPFSAYDEQAVWDSLESAHLKQWAMGVDNGLEYDVGEGGCNLSVGQRQLVCLARSLLHKTLILVLDEATAAVDLQTDELIQKTIREEFKECTVVTIAHRLNTILDYDRVMVLGAGKILEFDSPRALLDNPESTFYGMAVDAGLVNTEEGGSGSVVDGSAAAATGDGQPGGDGQDGGE